MRLFAIADRSPSSAYSVVATYLAGITVVAVLSTVMEFAILRKDLFLRLTNTCKKTLLAGFSQILRIKPAIKTLRLVTRFLFCTALLLAVSFIAGSLQATQLLGISSSNMDPKHVRSILIKSGFHDSNIANVAALSRPVFWSSYITKHGWKIFNALDGTTVTSLALYDSGDPAFSGVCQPCGEYSIVEWWDSGNSMAVLSVMASLQESLFGSRNGGDSISVDDANWKSLKSEAVWEPSSESLHRESIISTFDVYLKSLDRKTTTALVQLFKLYSGTARSLSTILITKSLASDREVVIIDGGFFMRLD